MRRIASLTNLGSALVLTMLASLGVLERRHRGRRLDRRRRRYGRRRGDERLEHGRSFRNRYGWQRDRRNGRYIERRQRNRRHIERR